MLHAYKPYKNPVTGEVETDHNLASIFKDLAKTNNTQEMSFFIARHGGHGKMGYFYPVVAQAYCNASDEMKKCIHEHCNFAHFLTAAKEKNYDFLTKYFGLNGSQAEEACDLMAKDNSTFTFKR